MLPEIPPAIRYDEPVDIGPIDESRTHLPIAILNHNARRRALLSGKKYLTYCLHFSTDDYYDYTTGYFFHTTLEPSEETYMSSGQDAGYFPREQIQDGMLRFIHSFLTEDITLTKVYIGQEYNEDPQLRYSGPVDSNWIYNVVRDERIRLVGEDNSMPFWIFGSEYSFSV